MGDKLFSRNIFLMIRSLLGLILLLAVASPLIAQIGDSSSSSSDTGFAKKIKLIQEAGIKELQTSLQKFRNDRDALRQEALVESLKTTTEKAKSYLRYIDTVRMSRELQHIKEWSIISGDGVFFNQGTAQTYRNLTNTSNILEELLKRIEAYKVQVDKYERELLGFRYRIDSLSADSALYNFPTDSAILVQYLQKLVIAVRTINPADSALTHVIEQVRNLQVVVNSQLYQLHTDLEQIDEYQKQLSSKLFEREFPGIWQPVGYSRPFDEIIAVSVKKSLLVLWFFVQNNFAQLLFLFGLVLGAMIFLNSLRKLTRQSNNKQDDFNGQLVIRYPSLSAIIIVFSLFQFMFIDAPFAFNAVLWTISGICLTIVFNNFISRFWMRVWLVMLILFLLASADNFILQASRIERWWMLCLATIGSVAGVFVLAQGRKQNLREQLILYFIALAVLLELLSVVMNILGRYNLSKTLMLTGYANVIIGILFLWTVRLINEGLRLASRAYVKQDKQLFYVNFEKVGERAPRLLYVLLVVGWFILVGRNVYAFRMIIEPVKNFFAADRTIGNYSFAIGNVLIFFAILLLAVIVSKVVSFFASDKSSVTHVQDRRPGLGSWLLLIRVSIITAGLLLALAASGFPIDRITIVIGALGIGVGLGLQTLVNNLVSGIIIAFEKPVNVGDAVEINGQFGSVKSIGFRSSVITVVSGADMVIPNGDLLNMHLINWSLGHRQRRMDLLVGLSYGSDLGKVKELILTLLSNDEKVLNIPPPVVLFQEFNNSSIDVKILFWVRDFREGFITKSHVIEQIDKIFKDNDIVIPFPQQDIHIIQKPQ